MTFESFKRVTDQMVQNSARLDSLYEHGIDLIEFTEGYCTIANLLWEHLLTAEGIDWFNWFMYEKGYIQDGIGDPKLCAFSKHGDDEIEIVKDLSGLYEYFIENNYFKCESQK